MSHHADAIKAFMLQIGRPVALPEIASACNMAKHSAELALQFTFREDGTTLFRVAKWETAGSKFRPLFDMSEGPHEKGPRGKTWRGDVEEEYVGRSFDVTDSPLYVHAMLNKESSVDDPFFLLRMFHEYPRK